MAKGRQCATSITKDQEKANQLILITYGAKIQLSIVLQINDWKRQSLNHISTEEKAQIPEGTESAVE